MFPEWRTENGGFGASESHEYITKDHMGACNNSAIISEENFALGRYIKLKYAKKPVYFGKDVIHEDVMMYKYYGYWPTNLKLKPSYLFNTGIIEWWQKYFKCYWVLRTRAAIVTNETGSRIGDFSTCDERSKTGIYVLSFIPYIGLVLSILVFVFCDIKLYSLVHCSMLKIL